MRPTTELPDDPALPGLAAIRAAGLARAIPALGLGGGPVDLRLCGYTPGGRATLELRAGSRHLAIKVYAEDPAPEAELYEALGAAGLAPSRPGTGLAGVSGVRVPPFVLWERALRVLVIGWLEGRPASELIDEGRGERAGELGAAWTRCSASLPLELGPPCGAGWTLYRVGRSVAALEAADAALGADAKAIGRTLARVQPGQEARRLVHGTLYDRHVLDLGDGGGPGVIDWQRFGQGPLEIDAGMFLATIWRSRRHGGAVAAAAARAEQTFLMATAGLLDERSLAWYRAAALLRLAGHVKVAARRKVDWQERTHAVLREAARLGDRAKRSDLVERAAAPASVTHKGSPLEVALRALSATLNGSALEFALRALSTRPANPEELDEIRRLLERVKKQRS